MSIGRHREREREREIERERGESLHGPIQEREREKEKRERERETVQQLPVCFLASSVVVWWNKKEGNHTLGKEGKENAASPVTAQKRFTLFPLPESNLHGYRHPAFLRGYSFFMLHLFLHR